MTLKIPLVNYKATFASEVNAGGQPRGKSLVITLVQSQSGELYFLDRAEG